MKKFMLWSKFHQFCSLESYLEWISIGSVMAYQQTLIIWANADQVQWHIYASPTFKELVLSQMLILDWFYWLLVAN